MFDMGMSHLIVIAIVGILVLGPDKLPGFIKDGVRVWRTIRDLANTTQNRITDELLPEVSDEVRALGPRGIVEHVLLGDDTDTTKERVA